MEKLPEKWCIKNDHQEVRDWLADMYCKEVKNWTHYEYIGFHGGDSHNGCLGAPLAYHTRNGSTEITFDQFKRLVLGETEEYKAGDWVVITTWQGGSDEGSVVKLIQAGQYLTYKNDMGTVLSASPECVRLARPEEIPQEEVGYVECVGNKGKSTYPLCSDLLIGKIYSTKDKTPWRSLGSWNEVLGDSCYGKNFKPSTREAYEAQQNNKYKGEWKVECDCFDGCIKCKEVNKCSTINTNQNGKNESCETKINLDGNSSTEGGKDVRPRAKSVRNLCEGGSIESGNEIDRARKHRKRFAPERGETYF